MQILELLLSLQELQSKGTDIYAKGVFPSQRFQPKFGFVREDDNIFFTACIVHILQNMKDYLQGEEQDISNEICNNSIASYPLYKNKDGRDTYNFWRTQPSHHFPNGIWMHRFDHFRIPDDIDDTSLIFLTENASKERVALLRETLKHHANLGYGQVQNTPEDYQNLKVYSTFIGKKMYIEFDVCALSNLMRLFLTHFPEELNEYDFDTLKFICQVVEKSEFDHVPFQIAPQYTSTSTILCHLARLLPYLPSSHSYIHPKLIDEMMVCWKRLPQGMEKLLLENELLKLNIHLEPLESFSLHITKSTSFFYFIAGILTAYKNSTIRKAATSPWTQLRYRSEAFNLTLLLENAVLRRNLLPSQPMA